MYTRDFGFFAVFPLMFLGVTKACEKGAPDYTVGKLAWQIFVAQQVFVVVLMQT